MVQVNHCGNTNSNSNATLAQVNLRENANSNTTMTQVSHCQNTNSNVTTALQSALYLDVPQKDKKVP